MAGRKLASYVHVDGVAYGPDDQIPADVAKRIVNEDAWEPATKADPKSDKD